MKKTDWIIMITAIALVALVLWGPWYEAEAQRGQEIEKREPRVFVIHETFTPQDWNNLLGMQKSQIAQQRNQRAQQLEAQGKKVARGGGVKGRVKGKGRNK